MASTVDHRQAAAIKSKGKNFSNKRRRSEESVKVVYISTPMKVKTSASRFRSLVQELTGQDSDISRFSDVDLFYNASATAPTTTYSDVVPNVSPAWVNNSNEYCTSRRDSPTSSDSLLDDVFNSDMVERLEGMFPSSMFCDHSSSQLINVPNSY